MIRLSSAEWQRSGVLVVNRPGTAATVVNHQAGFENLGFGARSTQRTEGNTIFQRSQQTGGKP
jgi:hypothetical protein